MNVVSDWIRAYRIHAFFLLAFAITWTLNGLAVVFAQEMSWTRFFFSGFLSAAGPAFAAVIVLYVSGENLREWAKGIIHWRVHPKWYVAAIGIPAALGLGTAVLASLMGGPVDFAAFSPGVMALAFGLLLATFIGGGQEEIGWRGFAQPELQDRYSGLTTSLIIGFAWAVWHLPLFFDPFAPHSGFPLGTAVAWFVGIVGFSVVIGWVYNGTGGSILLAMIMHGGINAISGGLVPLDVDLVIVDSVIDYSALITVNVSNAVLTWAFALIVVAVVGASLLSERTSDVLDG